MPLTFVHGLEPVKTNIQQDYFNFLGMTSGEMYLHLLGAQLRTYQQAYGGHDLQKLWRKGENEFLSAIYNGLHGNNAMPSGIPDERLYPVYEAIRNASKQFTTASKSGIALVGRKRMTDGLDPLLQLQPLENGINGFTVTSGCYTKYSANGTGNDFVIVGANADCLRQKDMQDTLNKHFEKSAHHVLYEFATDEQAMKVRETQKWKIGQHQLATTEIATISKIDRANIMEWLRLGIMRQNAISSGEVIDPFTSIKMLSETDLTIAKIKEGGVNCGPACIALITVIVSAIVAAKDLILAIKGKTEPTAMDKIKGMGTEMFSADSTDFIKLIQVAS